MHVRPIVVISMAACLSAAVAPVLADILPYASIEELCDRADLIVRGAEHAGDELHIAEVYKGNSDAEMITVKGLGAFQTTVSLPPDRPADVGRRDVVLFLKRQPHGGYRPVAHGAGVKRLHEGQVFGYAQIMNPGGYGLVLSHESATDCSMRNYDGNREPLTVHLLSAYIISSLRSSREFKAALELADEKKRVPALSRYLTTHRGHSRYYARKALDALSKIGEPALPSVLNVLNAGVSNPGRREIVGQLGRFNACSAVPFLLNEMKNSTPGCRRLAIYSLGELKAREAVEPICEVLARSRDKSLTVTAIQVLGRIGDRRATPSITPHLAGGSPHVRYECAYALRFLKDPQAFEPLLEAIGDPLRKGDITFRNCALDALYRIDKARAVPVYIEHIRSPEPEVAHTARTCLIWTWKPLWEMNDYATLKAWYEGLPRDARGRAVLPKGK